MSILISDRYVELLVDPVVEHAIWVILRIILTQLYQFLPTPRILCQV